MTIICSLILVNVNARALEKPMKMRYLPKVVSNSFISEQLNYCRLIWMFSCIRSQTWIKRETGLFDVSMVVWYRAEKSKLFGGFLLHDLPE